MGNRRLRRTQRPQRRQRGTETGGVLAHAGQGALTRPGEQSVQAQRAKPSTATENREQSARQARDG